MEQNHPLYDYFYGEVADGKIDFSLRVSWVGPEFHFYIHPNGKDGDTRDFVLTSKELRLLNQPIKNK